MHHDTQSTDRVLHIPTCGEDIEIENDTVKAVRFYARLQSEGFAICHWSIKHNK